jgi:CUG-BP- and ETR3-like factor
MQQQQQQQQHHQQQQQQQPQQQQPAAGYGGYGGFDPSGGMGMGMGMAFPGMMGMPPGAMAMGGMAFPGMVGTGMSMQAAGPAAQLAAAKAWKLFVGQVSFDLGEEHLTPFFSQWGTVLELALPRTDGRSRGYAFVTFSSQAEAAAAIEGANGAVIPSDPRQRPIQVRWADVKPR